MSYFISCFLKKIDNVLFLKMNFNWALKSKEENVRLIFDRPIVSEWFVTTLTKRSWVIISIFVVIFS